MRNFLQSVLNVLLLVLVLSFTSCIKIDLVEEVDTFSEDTNLLNSKQLSFEQKKRIRHVLLDHESDPEYGEIYQGFYTLINNPKFQLLSPEEFDYALQVIAEHHSRKTYANISFEESLEMLMSRHVRDYYILCWRTANELCMLKHQKPFNQLGGAEEVLGFLDEHALTITDLADFRVSKLYGTTDSFQYISKLLSRDRETISNKQYPDYRWRPIGRI